MPRHRLRIVLALLAATLVAVFLGSAVAQAGSPYGRKTVTYRDKSGYPEVVRIAVGEWVRSGAGVRIVKARRGRRADIPIRVTPRVRDRQGNDVGGLGGVFYGVNMDGRSFKTIPFTRQVRAIAHELGHALGLPHNRSACSLLGPGGDDHPAPECNVGHSPFDGLWRCGPDIVEVRALARLYRTGPVNPPGDLGWCRAPAGLDAALEQPESVVRPDERAAFLGVRNTGTRDWPETVGLVPVDSAGGLVADGFQNERLADDDRRPGGLTRFYVQVCLGAAQAGMRRFQLVDTDFNSPIGPVLSATFRWPAEIPFKAIECG